MLSPLDPNNQQRDFMLAFHANDLVKIQYYLQTPNKFKMDSILANESVFGFALLNSNFTVVKWLFDFAGGDINKIPVGIYSNENWITKAGSNIDSRIMSFLLTQPIPNIKETVEAALNSSIAADHMDTFNVLINSPYANPTSALQSAIACNEKYVQMLLDYGADVNATYGNMNAIVFAMSRLKAHPLLYATLPNKTNQLYVGIYNNDANLIRSCMSNQAKVNFTAQLLYPPLLAAVRYSNLDTIKLVFSLFPNPNAKTGPHAVINTRFAGNLNIINLVIRRPFDKVLYDYVFSLGADKNNIGDDYTAFQNVVQEGNMDKINYMISKECDPNVITKFGTCGHVCVYSDFYNLKNTTIMKLLIKNGLNLYLGYPNTQEPYYRGVNVIDLAARLNKPNPANLGN